MATPAPGPLGTIGRGIEDRLKLVMPPNRFTYQYLPSKLDEGIWDLLTRRMPSISLQFGGFSRIEASAGLIGNTEWIVWLAVKNGGTTEALLFGDRLGDGALTVMQVAMAAVHGMRIPDGGTVQVIDAIPAAFPAKEDPSIYITGLRLRVERMQITPASVLSGDIMDANALLTEVIQWTFGDSTQIAQTDTIAVSATTTGTT